MLPAEPIMDTNRGWYFVGGSRGVLHYFEHGVALPVCGAKEGGPVMEFAARCNNSKCETCDRIHTALWCENKLSLK